MGRQNEETLLRQLKESRNRKLHRIRLNAYNLKTATLEKIDDLHHEIGIVENLEDIQSLIFWRMSQERNVTEKKALTEKANKSVVAMEFNNYEQNEEVDCVDMKNEEMNVE